MQDNIVKTAGTREMLSIRCPKCGSPDVLVECEGAYFWVSHCRNCNYKRSGYYSD